MILLDTNVVSEITQPNPEQRVVAWTQAQPRNQLFVASPIMAELRYGVLRLAAGRRQHELIQRYEEFRRVFRSRVWSFDLRAAEAFAALVVSREQSGAPIGVFDAQIAAIAKTRGAAVATRNTRDFAGCGVDLIDPWA